MNIKANSKEPRIIYIYAENEEERKVLDEMWKDGIVACIGGYGELGICSKSFFGSGVQSSPKVIK